MSKRCVSPNEVRAVTAATMAVAVACGAAAAFVLWARGQQLSSDAFAAEVRAGRRELLAVSAAAREPPESESEVDAALPIGAAPLLPAAMVDSFATPYLSPSPDAVLLLLQSGMTGLAH